MILTATLTAVSLRLLYEGGADAAALKHFRSLSFQSTTFSSAVETNLPEKNIAIVRQSSVCWCSVLWLLVEISHPPVGKSFLKDSVSNKSSVNCDELQKSSQKPQHSVCVGEGKEIDSKVGVNQHFHCCCALQRVETCCVFNLSSLEWQS